MKVLPLFLLICCRVIATPAFAQSEPSQELFVPILINGVPGGASHYLMAFSFVELSGTTTDPAVAVDMEVFDDAGNHIEPSQLFCNIGVSPDPPVPFRLPGLGSSHFATAGRVLGYQPPSVIEGWARLTTTGPGRIQATAQVFQLSGSPPYCLEVPFFSPSDLYAKGAVVHPVKPAKAFRAAAVITPQWHTAFSVVNPSKTDTAHVFIELFHQSGTLLQRGLKVDVPPLHRRSAFAWEWADTSLSGAIGIPVPVPNGFWGSARIVSDLPVAVGALQVLLPEGKLVSVSVTPDQ